jgi:hypothetical protein
VVVLVVAGRRTGLQHTCGQGDPNSCQQHEPSNHRRSSCQATLTEGDLKKIGGDESKGGEGRNARQGGWARRFEEGYSIDRSWDAAV